MNKRIRKKWRQHNAVRSRRRLRLFVDRLVRGYTGVGSFYDAVGGVLMIPTADIKSARERALSMVRAIREGAS